MWLVIIFGLIFPIIYSHAVVNRYFSFKLHKNVYPLTLVILMLNMVILLSTTYLLPLDIFYGARRNDEDVSYSFGLIWKLIYWSEFVLCWLIIPVLISYLSLKYACGREEEDRSDRSPVGKRLALAVYQNIKFYSLCLVGLFVGIVYLMSSTGHNLGDFKPLLISLVHLYSLSYMLILLSTGLIIFPKNLFSHVNSPKNEQINKLFVELSKTNDDLNDSQLSMLENAERILHSPEVTDEPVFNNLLNQCKIEVQALLNEQQLSIGNYGTLSTGSSVPISTLQKLNHHYNNFITHFYNYLNNKTNSDSIIHTLAKSQSLSDSSRNFRKFSMTILAILSATLSILVAYLEITPNKWGHAWVFDGTHWYNFGLELVLFSYNALVALYAMSKFKFNNFHLIPNGRSNPSNALYYSLYSSRLLFPLCFNLMVLIPSGENASYNSMNSSFAKTLYESLIRIPLANYLNRLLPPVFMISILIGYQIDLKQKLLLRIFGEECYYQFFGMMMYEPVSEADLETPNNTSSTSLFLNDNGPWGQRSRMDEDYEYSIQDGRYLFERASGHSGNNNADGNEYETTSSNFEERPLSYI